MFLIDENVFDSPFLISTEKELKQEEYMISEERCISDFNLSFEDGGSEEIICS